MELNIALANRKTRVMPRNRTTRVKPRKRLELESAFEWLDAMKKKRLVAFYKKTLDVIKIVPASGAVTRIELRVIPNDEVFRIEAFEKSTSIDLPLRFLTTQDQLEEVLTFIVKERNSNAKLRAMRKAVVAEFEKHGIKLDDRYGVLDVTGWTYGPERRAVECYAHISGHIEIRTKAAKGGRAVTAYSPAEMRKRKVRQDPKVLATITKLSEVSKVVTAVVKKLKPTGIPGTEENKTIVNEQLQKLIAQRDAHIQKYNDKIERLKASL